ncbi:unnamed protein product [Caenorhabditis auriculariae]|uniref:Amine oxidase domain-containing protein n=1 Tax=Caenorhabditis auriculariae TaxID=2777116 RepID=A0A8S1HDJ6_9PELO|nr:unnamed protein product [Caenorhabditis auriculariae]
MKFVIIGSGPTALGAAFRLYELIENGSIPSETEVLIVEKERDVGGLARSVTDDRGFTWDLGVHITGASKYIKFTNTINTLVDAWNVIPRRVKAYMAHVTEDGQNVVEDYVPYPVQNSIPYFKEEMKKRCLEELSQLPTVVSHKNFGEFTRDTFGESLQKEFIRPYNEKVWTVKLEEMNTAWVANRVPRPEVGNLRRRCDLSIEQLQEEENKEKQLFKYPKKLKGAGEMWRLLASRLPAHWFKFNCELQRVDPVQKKVFIRNNRYTTYSHLISTMSIVELGKASGLLLESKLKHSKVVLVGVGVRTPQPECTFISNFNERLTPNPVLYWSMICEIGLPADATVDEQELIDKTILDLRQHGLLDEENQVIHRWIHVLPLGYPIPTVDRDEELRTAHQTLEKHSIFSRGRSVYPGKQKNPV